MPEPELDALLVENIADLDATVKHLNRVESQIFERFDIFVEQWAEINGWNGTFNFLEEELWLAPEAWKQVDDDEPYAAYFYFDVAAGDKASGESNEDWYWLTRLCGARVGQIGFKFGQELVTVRKFKKQSHEVASLTQGTAFSRDPEGNFFMPFRLDLNTLSSALRSESVEDAFKPLREALEKLKAAEPAFDSMLAKIKEWGN